MSSPGFRPLLCAAFAIAIVGGWLAFRIPQGVMTYPDELLTAERSREMLLLGRGTVHFNFRPSYAKPPLQYWLTTLSLPRIQNRSTAVRLWPLLYGLGTAAAVGWLAFLLAPTARWLVALAVAIYLSCPLFSTEATRALLDTGLTFFTTLMLCFIQLARRRPVWWLAVGIACGLGAFQKIPLPLLVWAMLLIVRAFDRTARSSLGNKWLWTGLALALALSVTWPAVQYLQYHMPWRRAFAGDEPEMLFGHLAERPVLSVLDGLVLSGWAGGIFAVAAAVKSLARNEDKSVREIAIVALGLTLLTLVFGFRSVRYVLPIVPALAVLLALWLYRLGESSSRARPWVTGFGALLVAGGFSQAAVKMHHRPSDASEERQVAQSLGATQRSGMDTVLVAPGDGRHDLRSVAFYLFQGDLRFPLKRRTIDELRASDRARPRVGVCVSRDLKELQGLYPELTVVRATDRLTLWCTGATP